MKQLFPSFTVETIRLAENKKDKVTSYIELFERAVNKARRNLFHQNDSAKKIDVELVKTRIEEFAAFQNQYMSLSTEELTWELLRNSDYDVLITGSDVVWTQSLGTINRIKFLDFQNRNNAVKIAYAASFGENYIPKGNRRAIKKCLDNYKMVSVREQSAVGMLNEIGVNNVAHAVDPTLLLTASHWENLEKKPNEISENKKFTFVYVLGASVEQKNMIERISHEADCLIVYIPYASGINANNDSFGDISLKNCSPSEWIWLIHNAEYVITDSFHGLVFSTIFQSKFIMLKRNFVRDINVRITDYLELISQKDKYFALDKHILLNDLKWDYHLISSNLDYYRQKSVELLKHSFEDT